MDAESGGEGKDDDLPPLLATISRIAPPLARGRAAVVPTSLFRFLLALARSPDLERAATIGAVRAFTIFTLLAGAAAAQEIPEDAQEAEARALLARAEAAVADSQHAEARRLYERVAERFPATRAGEVARRRGRPSAYLGKSPLVEHGPSENRLDIVVTGEAYDLGHLGTFVDVAKDVPPVLERNEVFGEYWSYLNLLRADVVSEEDNIDGFGREYATAFGGAVSESEQGQVSVNAPAVRQMLLDEIPEADGLALVLVRTGVSGSGGGGVAAIGAREFQTLLHELGHAFADLGDEYSTHTGLRERTAARPNVSTTDDPKRVAWAHFLKAKVRGVGVYEGADGKVRGAFKPTSAGCILGEGEFYCPVCREALVLRLHEFVDPIDAAVPEPGAEPIRVARDAEPLEFRLRLMRPASHRLEASFWLFEAAAAPPEAPYDAAAADLGRRRTRGPLAPIARKPDFRSDNAADGVYEFRVDPRDLAPGDYALVARAEDKTELRGEKWPWVLLDEAELLRSERVWRIRVE